MNEQKLEYLKYLRDYETRIVTSKGHDNHIFVKREDDIPYSFGGNKVRIVCNYLIDAIEKQSDTIITYGSSSSNLCRILAGLCADLNLRCVIVSPEEQYIKTTNSVLVKNLNAEIIKAPLSDISGTIDRIINKERIYHRPYFIYGGGHGVTGTDAYRIVYRQILAYEKQNHMSFNRIFITCATGTSMSGLIIESALHNKQHKIYGVTIAREKDRVENIMEETVYTYLKEYKLVLKKRMEYQILDSSRCDGYGLFNQKVLKIMKQEFISNGLNLDTTYTGKGFCGMLEYLNLNTIKDENILFIYTGGTPLFFNDNCNWIEEIKE